MEEKWDERDGNGGGDITEKSAAEAADSKTKEKRRVKKEEKNQSQLK